MNGAACSWHPLALHFDPRYSYRMWDAMVVACACTEPVRGVSG